MSQELHNKLASPRIAGPICLVPLVFTNAATADATVHGFVATRRCRIHRASYIQSSDATAATSFIAKLDVGGTALTEDLDIATLAANAGADFVPVDGVEIADGDIVDVVFDETGGTVTAPDDVRILIELQLLE